MPKVEHTRKQRANELLARIERGPAMVNPGVAITQDEITRCYRIWMDNWIRDELIDLIPELREQHAAKDH